MISTGQEDKRNPKLIQESGCNLFSHWWHVEKITGKHLFDTPEQIIIEYNKLLNNGLKDIKPDCTIEDGELLFSLYGIRVKQVLDVITGSSKLSPNMPIKDNQIVIIQYQWDEKLYTHFNPGNKNKESEWDTIVRGSNTKKYGYLHSLRLYNLL